MNYQDVPPEIRDIPRAMEIVDMMQFFEFGLLPNPRFEGSICFTFSVEGSKRQLQYLVTCKKHQGIQAKLVKEGTKGLKYDCEVISSIEDFLHVYSGKASASEVAKMCYTGRVSVSGFQFRLITRFLQSFDFSSEKWNDFYEWHRTDRNKLQYDGGEDNNDHLEYLPRQIALYIHRGGVNMTMIQRTCFEASMSKIFGPRVLFTYTSLVHKGANLSRSSESSLRFRHKKFGRSIRSVHGYLPKRVSSKVSPSAVCAQVMLLWDEAYPLLQNSPVLATSNDSTILHWNNSMLNTFQDTEYKPSKELEAMDYDPTSKRIDIRDAGMDQLSKIMDNVIGERQPAKSNYLSAPARLMFEIRKWMNQEPTTSSTSIQCVLRDIDMMISGELGNPVLVRPPHSQQKEVPTAEIIRYNTKRDIARMKKSIAGLKRNLLQPQVLTRPLPESMNYVMLDY